MNSLKIKIYVLTISFFILINGYATDFPKQKEHNSSDSTSQQISGEFDETFVLEEAKRLGLNPVEAMYYVQNIKASYLGLKYVAESFEQNMMSPQGTQQSNSSTVCFGFEAYQNNSASFYSTPSQWSGQTFYAANFTPVANNSTTGFVRGRHTLIRDKEMKDPIGNFPMVAPRWSTDVDGSNNVSLRLGNRMVGGEAESIKVKINVNPSQDLNKLIAYSYALVLQDPSASSNAPPHSPQEKPYFEVRARIGGTSPQGYSSCAGFKVIAGSNLTGYFYAAGGSYVYKPWTQMVFNYEDLPGYSTYASATSMEIELEFITADCALGGHFGYAYIDVSCTRPEIKRTGSSCSGGYSTFSSTLFGNYRKENVTWTFREKIGTASVDIATITGTITINEQGVKTVNLNSSTIELAYLEKVKISESTTLEKPKLSFDLSNPIEVLLTIDQRDANNSAICSPYNPVSQLLTYQVTPCINRKVKCAECITSFAPVPGNKYVLSAWVREETTQPLTYTEPAITIVLNGPGTTYTFQPKGKIIDGWQKVEEEFWVPEGTYSIDIILKNGQTTSTQFVYFDDLRIFPFKANMKSYVYDPYTQKLVAELDENNYATYYEYDEEGGLKRVKKETERGVMTIKESGSNQSQRP